MNKTRLKRLTFKLSFVRIKKKKVLYCARTTGTFLTILASLLCSEKNSNHTMLHTFFAFLFGRGNRWREYRMQYHNDIFITCTISLLYNYVYFSVFVFLRESVCVKLKWINLEQKLAQRMKQLTAVTAIQRLVSKFIRCMQMI